jgi:hypothetical protein
LPTCAREGAIKGGSVESSWPVAQSFRIGSPSKRDPAAC